MDSSIRSEVESALQCSCSVETYDKFLVAYTSLLSESSNESISFEIVYLICDVAVSFPIQARLLSHFRQIVLPMTLSLSKSSCADTRKCDIIFAGVLKTLLYCMDHNLSLFVELISLLLTQSVGQPTCILSLKSLLKPLRNELADATRMKISPLILPLLLANVTFVFESVERDVADTPQRWDVLEAFLDVLTQSDVDQLMCNIAEFQITNNRQQACLFSLLPLFLARTTNPSESLALKNLIFDSNNIVKRESVANWIISGVLFASKYPSQIRQILASELTSLVLRNINSPTKGLRDTGFLALKSFGDLCVSERHSADVVKMAMDSYMFIIKEVLSFSPPALSLITLQSINFKVFTANVTTACYAEAIFPSLENVLISAASSSDDALRLAAETVMGELIKVFGVEKCLSALGGFRFNEEALTCDDGYNSRGYLLPLIQKYSEVTSMRQFIGTFLTCADKLRNQSKNLGFLPIYYYQLWNLLPTFVSRSTDFDEVISQLGVIIDSSLQDPELVPIICNSINIAVKKFSTSVNFRHFCDASLPSFIALYIGAPVARRNFILDAVKSMLTLCSASCVSSLFASLSRKFMTSLMEQCDTAVAVLDILVSICSLLTADDKALLMKLFLRIYQHINTAIRKKSYVGLSNLIECMEESALRVFAEDILAAVAWSVDNPTGSVSLFQFYASILVSPLAEDIYSPLFVKSIGQVILGMRELNEKSRSVCSAVLLDISRRLIDRQMFESLIRIILGGMAAKTYYMVTCSISALNLVISSFHALISENFVDEITLLVPDVAKLLSLTSELHKPFILLVRNILVFFRGCLKVEKVPLLLSLLFQNEIHKTGSQKLLIRHVIEKIIPLYDSTLVEASFPEDHKALLHSIRKHLRNKHMKKDPTKSDASNLPSADLALHVNLLENLSRQYERIQPRKRLADFGVNEDGKILIRDEGADDRHELNESIPESDDTYLNSCGGIKRRNVCSGDSPESNPSNDTHRSKKRKGDTLGKDGVEPFAYIPLSRKLLNTTNSKRSLLYHHG